VNSYRAGGLTIDTFCGQQSQQVFFRFKCPFFAPGRKYRIALALPFDHNPSMLARVLSAAVNGIEAFPVEVEVNCGWGDTVIVMLAHILRMRHCRERPAGCQEFGLSPLVAAHPISLANCPGLVIKM
jgi:hypothetical protein